LQNIENKKQKALIRSESLDAIANICDDWMSYLNRRDEFFNEICDNINNCYLSANVYFGKLHLHSSSIEYILASPFSKMKGKKLLRASNTGISFSALDNFTNITVINTDTELIKKMHFFGSRESLEYPFVVIPVITHLDSVIGVLAADSCEDISQEDGRTDDVTSFMTTVSVHLGNAMKGFVLSDIRNLLKDTENNAHSFNSGIRVVKEQILELLPYASRVAEVKYESELFPIFRDNTLLSGKVFETSVTHICLIHFISAICFMHELQYPIIVVQYNNTIIKSFSCTEEDIKRLKPIQIIIPQGVLYNNIDIKIILRGKIHNIDRDVSKLSLKYNFLVNSGAKLYTFTLENENRGLPDVHSGQVKFVQRLYNSDDDVRIFIRKINCMNITVPHGKSSSSVTIDPFCVIIWKGNEIGRTEPVKNSMNPKWKDLNIAIKPSPTDDSRKGYLKIEVWNVDDIGMSTCLGYTLMSSDELKSTGTKWRPLRQNLSSEIDSTGNVIKTYDEEKMLGAINIHTEFMTAATLSESIQLEELNIPFLSNVIKDKNSSSSGGTKETHLDVADSTSKKRDVVINILKVRDLVLNPSQTTEIPPVDHFDTELRDYKPFCVIFFNNAEVYRTSSANIILHSNSNSSVTKQSHYSLRRSYFFEFVDESCQITIPLEMELENCSLRLEIWVIDEFGKNIQLGSSTIGDKQFASLVSCNFVKNRWLDIIDPCYSSDVNIDNNNIIFSHGEILISGMPRSVSSTMYGESTNIAQINSYDLSVVDIDLSHLFDNEITMESAIMQVRWNNMLCVNTKLPNKSVFDPPVENVDESFTNREYYNNNLKAVINKPQLLPFEFCKLRIDILTPDSMAENGDSQETVLVGVLSGQDLLYAIGQEYCRSVWVDIIRESKNDNDKIYGVGSCAFRVKVRLGPVGAVDMIEFDGREVAVDILAVSKLRNVNIGNKRVNAYCKAYYNDEIVGQTTICYAAFDAVWNWHRFVVKPPLVENVNDSLSLCSFRVEVWTAGTDSTASEKASSINDQKKSLFLGCVEVEGDDFVNVVHPKKPKSKWFPIKGLSNSILDIDQSYVCNNGAVKLRFGLKKKLMPGQSVSTGQIKGEEYFIKIHKANNLSEIDIFTKTNAVVIIYWNETEIGRTSVGKNTVNPEWTNESFLLIVPVKDSLEYQKLQLHVYDTTFGSTGEFLGAVEFLNAESLIKFLRDDNNITKEFPLTETKDLPSDANHLVKGSLFISASTVHVPPFEYPIQLYKNAILQIKSAENILMTNIIEECSDVLCILYWSSVYDNSVNVEIGRTTMIQKSRNPVWRNEYFLVKVPDNDEWTGIELKIVLYDLVSDLDRLCVGSVVIKGNDLKSILERYHPFCLDTVTYALDKMPPMNSDNKPNTGAVVQDGIAFVPQTISGRLLIAGGRLEDMKQYCPALVNDSTDNKDNILEHHESFHDGNSLHDFSSEMKENKSISVKDLTLQEKKSGVVSPSKKEKDVGQKVIIKIHKLLHITLPFFFVDNNTNLDSINPYFIITFDTTTIKNDKVKPIKVNSGINCYDYLYENDSVLSLSFYLPKSNDPSECNLQIEAYLPSPKDDGNAVTSIADMKSISNSVSTDTYVSINTDVFLGMVELSGVELVRLLRPRAGEKILSLRARGSTTVGSSRPGTSSSRPNTSGSDYAKGATIVISGNVPDLSRSLSSKKKSSKKEKEQMSTKKTNWRSLSSNLNMEEEVTNPLLLKKLYELHICEAKHLSSVSSLLSTYGDIYVDVFWRDEKIGSTHEMTAEAPQILLENPSDEKSNTETEKDFVDCVWENELFVLEKPEGELLVECELRLEVYEKRKFSQSPAFLGQVLMSGDAFQVWVDTATQEPTWLKLKHSDTIPEAEQKRVQGSLFLGIRDKEKTHDAGNPEVDMSLPLPPGYRDVEINILTAFNLGKVDTFSGTSDPFCVVKWDMREIGTSAVVKKTTSPIWEDACYKLRIPTHLHVDHSQKPDSNIFGVLGSKNDESIEPGISVKKKRAAVNIQPMSKEDVKVIEHNLTIEIWDKSTNSGNVFLGCHEFKGNELSLLFDMKTYGNRKLYKLNRTKRLAKKNQKYVKGNSTVEVLINPIKVFDAHSIKYELEVEIAAASGLTKTDRFSNTMNLFCILRWNHKIFGKTSSVIQGTEPKWKNEISQLVHQGEITDACLLYIELWNNDNAIGQGKFLGSVELKGDVILDLINSNNSEFQWYEIAKSNYLNSSLQKYVKGGKMSIRISDGTRNANAKNDFIIFEISILEATNLMKPLLGHIDSFCVIKLNGREIGQTVVAPKTENPKWIGERYTIKMKDNPNIVNEITLEMWSSEILGRGEFLGCVVIDMKELLYISNDDNFLSKKNKNILTRGWYSMQKTIGLPEIKQKNVQGNIHINCKVISHDSYLNNSPSAEVSLQWPVPPSPIPGSQIGLPIVNIKVLSCSNLIVPPSSSWVKLSSSTCDPFCIIYCNGLEVGMTNVCPNTTNPVWRGSEPISLKLPENVDKQEFWINIEVYNMQGLERGEFLGLVTFNFWSLFCLQNGKFTLPLRTQSDEPEQFIIGTITFTLDIQNSFWDTVKSINGPSIERKIQILGANNLPNVNNNLPSTKCIIIVDGIVKYRSVLESSTNTPHWLPIPEYEMLLDYRIPSKVVIQLFFVDVKEKKEVCMGEVIIPPEFILRPPTSVLNLWLCVPSRATAHVGYDFITDGSINILITNPLKNEESSAIWIPYSSRFFTPQSALSVKDINTEWNEKSYLNEGDILRSDELYWLGTNINFTSPNEIAARPEWLLLPLKDMGIIMDGTQYGTLLSQKYALAIQRPLNKLFSSDSTMLNEIYSDIQKSVIKLRRHEIYTNLRNLSLIKLRLFFENLLKTNTFKLSVFMKRISRVVLTCFPGSIFFMSQISKDYRSMRYSLFEKSHENELLNPLFFILWENQGCDWNSIGRHAISGSFENTSDFKSEYMKKYRLMTFSPFRQYRFPRIVYPLRSGDISSGVIGIENFDIYRGGLSEDVSDIGQVKEWFSQLGEICGDALYIGKERKALKAMEMYVLLASSSFTGLLSVLLENSLSVLQGCKLMEVWSINNKNRIKSLATSWPESISPPGRWVMLRDIKITFIKKAEDHKKNDLTLSRISNFLLRKPQEKVGDVAAVATRHNDDKNKLVSNDSEVCVGFVLGVYYGGFEECQYVDYIPNKKGVISDEYPILNHTFSSMKLYMNNDRDIIINIYYVNSQCAVLQQYIGKLQIITFKEKILNCNLYYNNIVRDVEYYSVQCNVTWPSGKNAAQRAVELKELAKVKEFVINIVSAFSLMKADLVGSSDPFCEIYWKGDLIGKTAVKKDNLDPVWNETFTVPIGSHIDSKDVYDLSIEIYDMNFLGKGSFLGKTSLGLEQLLFPPSDSIKIPLEPKENTTKSNLKTVGGYITLQHSVVYKEAEDIIEVMTTSNSKNNNISATMQSKLIEKLIFMENPVLKLLIAKADGLAKSDTIGASDPYVKIYRVDPKAVNKEANKKSNKSIIEEDDPIAITRVINQTLSPVWNEEHIFNLNIPITTVSKTSKNAFKEDVPVTYGLDSLSAWPAFCLEVWDKDNVGLGKFLGGVVLTPQIYCFKHNCGLELSTLPKYPKKDDFIKYVKGSIYLKFQIQENVDNKIINKNLMLNSYAYMSYSTVVELFVLSGNGLSKKSNNALMQKTVNSYCKILWGKDKIGETACKYNTLYPTWANERFAINITDAINSSLSVELVIEVWNKKSKSETVTNSKDEFIGEICIPIIELMHPVSNDTITKNLITKAQGNKPSRTLSSSISFRLITKHLPLHYRCKPKDIQIAEIKEEIISSKHKADPIETYYNIEKVRVVTSSPIDLSIIPDVEAEEQRQKYEKLKLDKIINKLQQEENDYVQTAFDQHGVISELHYGQTLYAVERNENTVLHISNSADVYIMPAIVKDPEEVYSISDSDTFAHIESKQHEQKDQQKSVEANDTSKTTQKGKSLVKSKSVSLYDDDIDIKDIVEDVAVVEEKPKRVNWKLKPVEVVEKREKLCLVSRYDQGKIPKRDTQFLLRLRDIISNSILLFEARQNRKIERRGIVHHFQQIYDNISRHHLEDIIMSAISHMEKIYDCSVDIYILQPKIVNNFGPTGYGRRKFNEKIFFSKSQIPLDELVMPQTVLMRCAHDSGMCINEPLASTSLQQFIDLASKICRHGLMLQFYRGNCSVIGCDWRRGFSEASINQFEDIKNTISVFESEETLNELQQLSRTEAAYGACVMPLMSIGDVFSGIMVLKGTDKIPQSLYRIKSQPVDTTGNNDVKKNKKTNNDDEEEDDDANVKEVEWFEEGTSETFRDISQCLGKCILSVNMSKAIRDVKTYPINEFTTELDIIRYTFRKLIEAVPAICEIAIWKIKVPQLSEITIDGKIITTVNANKGDSSLFSKIGLASLFSNFGKKSKVDNGDEGMLDISMDMSSGHGVSPYYQTDKASMNQIPVIQAGYFRSESAHPILSSPDERLIINGLMSKTQQNASVLEEGLNIPTILENDVQTLDETNNETESVITEQMSRNGITCYDEIPWKVDVPVSLANIINSGLKTFENDKDSESERSEVRSEVGDSDKNDEDDHESDDGFDAKSIKSLKSKNKSSIISVQKRPSFLSKMGQSMRSGVSFMSTKTEVVEKRPNEINPIVMAQCEIYRCLRMLNKTSFHINSGAGQYLSFFNLDSKKYLDKILKKLFISSIDNNNNNDVMDDISDIEEDEDEKNITKDGQNDAKESKDDGIDRTDKNANNDGTAESKGIYIY
jgi:Ca2+-dependent lipid-binding protein